MIDHCRNCLAAILAMLAAGAADRATAQEAAPLWQTPLDSLEEVATGLALDRTGPAQGDAAVRITTAWPSVVNLARIGAIAVDGVVLEYRASVRCEGLDGAAYLEMWVTIGSDGPYFSRGLDSTCRGSRDWQTLSTRFRLEEGQTPSDIALNIAVVGTGTVWVDDLKLFARLSE